MRYYLILQYRMINRQLAGFGIHPALGYALGLAAFTAFSIYLFAGTEFAQYIYIFAALSLVIRLSESKRNLFLKSCFRDHDHYLVRITENSMVILPFAIFLAVKLLLIPIVILIILSITLAFFRVNNTGSFTIPTPFGKQPFEFTVGFRNSILVFLLAYILAFISAWVDNFNLGVFSLLLVFLVCITFYFNPENEFYVWIYHFSPGKFIIKKINTAFLYSTFLSLPVTIVLITFFPGNSLIIAGFMALGYIYLATVILAKYSSYPNQISLPQFFILGLSAWFPPLLIAVIPFFYRQSVKRLKEIL